MALTVGTRVRVLPPFAQSFPREYTVAEPPALEEGQAHPEDVYFLDGVFGAFSSMHLQEVSQ